LAVGTHSQLGSKALCEVHHCLVDVFLWQLFTDGLQGDFQLISRLMPRLESSEHVANFVAFGGYGLQASAEGTCSTPDDWQQQRNDLLPRPVNRLFSILPVIPGEHKL